MFCWRAIMKKIFLSFTFLGAIYLILGCEATFNKIIEGLAEADCRPNLNIKVGNNLRVILFAKNHIYIDSQTNNLYEGYTKNRFGYKWKNIDLIKYRDAQINKFFIRVNEIFAENDVNIYIFNLGYEATIDPKMVIADTNPHLGAEGYTLEVINNTAKKEPEFVHIHWCWTNWQANLMGVGRNYYVVISDDPISGEKITPPTFAHELVHALGYEKHSEDPNNLMNEDPGKKLTNDQIQEIWNNINSGDRKLFSISCRK